MRSTLTLFFLLLAIAFHSHATTYQVGAGKTYENPNALYAANVLQDGDIVEIAAGTYRGNPALAVWRANNLTIKGVGGRPHMVADGRYIWGKGIWVFAGNNITVENIEFSGAAVPDKNGAGIRLDGIGMTARRCFFHDNENGILTSNPNAGDILIEFSEFARNGHGDGYSHNLYIGRVNKLTFRYNYSHHAKIGHNLKSRAKQNYISYNRIMDEETGNSSRLIDLSNGGMSIIMGNLLMQGNNAPNNNMVGYGLEGLAANAKHEFYFVNNTLVNKRKASCLFLDVRNGTSVANVSNNIFAGSGTLYRGQVATMNTNLISTNIARVGLVNEQAYDYRLADNSPAIDFGSTLGDVSGGSLTPVAAYRHKANATRRATANGRIDVGAYEANFAAAIPIVDTDTDTKPKVYPNPAQDVLYVGEGSSDTYTVTLHDAIGNLVVKTQNARKVDIAALRVGIYYLTIFRPGRKPYVEKVVKY